MPRERGGRGKKISAPSARIFSKHTVADYRKLSDHAAEIRLRAERKAGGMLAKMERGRPKKGSTVKPLLSDLGISNLQSHRYQKSSRVPEPKFEAFIAETVDADGPVVQKVRNASIWWLLAYHQTL